VLGDAWTNRGPDSIDRSVPPSNYDHASGRVLALAFAPADTVENFEKIYLGSAGGGVWRASWPPAEGGAHWLPLTDNMPSPSIGALAVHATNPRVIFAGTGEMAACQYSCLYGLGIYKSLDAGHSWVQRGSDLFRGAAISAIVVNPEGRDTNHIFAATVSMNTPGIAAPPQGVSVSINLGDAWSDYPPAGPNSLTGRAVTDLVIDRRGNLYAAVSGVNGCTAPAQGCGIWYSSDEAATWRQISNGLPAIGGEIHKLAGRRKS
jgi:hypothetical protein